MKEKKESRQGRHKETERINGSALKDAIIKKYHFIQKAADKIHVSRARLSWCLANNEMKAEHLDEICRLLDHAPAFYDPIIGGRMLLDPETGKADRFPAYANNDFYIFWYRDAPELMQLPLTAIELFLRRNFDEWEMPEDKAQLIIEKLRGSDSYTDPGTAADQIREGIDITDLLECMQDALQKYFDRINTDQLTEDQKARLSEKYRKNRRPDLD